MPHRLIVAIVLCSISFSMTLGTNSDLYAVEKVSPDTYLAGVAKVDITPDYPIRLSGFGFRRDESEGVVAPIYARAVALSTLDGLPFVYIAVDSTGLSESIVMEVTRQLEPLGITRSQLVIAATHSHTAPMLEGVLPTLFGLPIPEEHQAHIKQYTAELTAKLVSVAKSAIESRQRAQLSWGTGKVTFSKNRRNSESGPIDQGLPVLSIRAESGDLMAVVTNYACHAVTLSHNFIGGDWPGFAAEWIEKRHPEAVALVTIGCGADQNPIPGVLGDKVDVAQAQGLEIAQEVDRVLSNALRPISGAISGEIEEISLPLEELPPRSFWEERVKVGKYIGHHAQTQLDILDAGGTLPTTVSYKPQTWAFGESFNMAFLPGEVVVDYAIELRKRLDPARLWINAYANDCPCYIPSERVLKEGGYEGATSMTYYNKPAKFAPGLEQKIVSSVVGMTPALFKTGETVKNDAGLPPLSPVQSLNRLTIPQGWMAQVVAAEPLTTDPVAIDFGPDGALWVCEMHDYPSGVAGNFEAGGKVRILRDQDGDGVYDSSTLFMDELPFPTGVTVWRNGVLICAAPDIIYAEDTDGDDVFDHREVLYSGFGTENYQARVNSLTFGLDGWVYGSCGLFGGSITCHKTGEVIPLGNRDFRINPDIGTLEPLTGRSQQGRVRNDAGDWFGCSNGQPCWHYPILKDDTRPGLSLPPLITSVPDGDARKLFPSTAEYQRFKLSGPAGRVTAGCGIGNYRDNWLGEALAGNSIVCEPVNLLLHRRVLNPVGLTFSGSRAAGEEESELVTSTDNWFRPVQVKTGLDGGLWISDMSRAVIEHPRWIPPETLAQLDVRAGDQQGRIIRLLPRERGARPVPDFSKLSGPELVNVLRSDNGTQRDLAQQLLFWKKDISAIEPLRTLVLSDANAAGKAAALWVLAKYEELDSDLIAVALQSDSPLFRRQAALVAADNSKKIENVEKLLATLDGESDLFVISALVEALRGITSEGSSQRLAELFEVHASDRHLQFQILRAVSPVYWTVFVESVLNQQNPQPAKLSPLLSISLASTDTAALELLLNKILSLPTSSGQLALLQPIVQAASGTGDQVPAWLGASHQSQLNDIVAQARKTVVDEQASVSLKIASIDLLGFNKSARGADEEILYGLLEPQVPLVVQQRALQRLVRINPSGVVEGMLSKFDSLSPALVDNLLDELLKRPESTRQLLTAMEQAEVSVNLLNSVRRDALLKHPDDTIRLAAEKLLQDSQSVSRQGVINEYRPALLLTGNAERGLALYQKHCSICHKYEQNGYEVGPALSESRNKSWSQLLNSILDPSQAVDQRYMTYVVAMTDGRVIQGMLTNESGAAITIQEQKAKKTVIARDEIEVLKRTNRSLMPEGLEKELSRQDLADLFALITSREQSTPEERIDLRQVATQLLDDSIPQKEREQLLAQSLHDPAGLIRELLSGLSAGDLKDEYRRIPWIWRVSIAAAKANKTEDLQSLLEFSLPQAGSSLQEWQAVVIGGGIINGITQVGIWPHERIAEVMGNNVTLKARWNHALEQAAEMSDDESVKAGTRYDALRMIAMKGWSGAGAQLEKYATSANQELQMGAVSGLADIPDPPATAALISALPHLTARNRALALEGLVRSENRIRNMLNACVDGSLSADLIDDATKETLLKTRQESLRQLAQKVFSQREEK